MDTRYTNFLSSLKILIQLFIIGLFIFFLSRVVFLFAYGDFNDLKNYQADVLYAFIMGLRFDAKVLAFGLLPLALLSLTQLFNKRKTILDGFYCKASLLYGLMMLLLFTLIVIIDYYFFKFFNTRISVLFFGIIEDDTRAVLKSVWTDYPVVLIFTCLTAATILLFLLLKRLLQAEVKRVYVHNIWLQAVSVALFLGLYFLGLRGSIGVFPLDVRHTTISKNAFINTLTMNGVFALKTAFADKKDSKINTNIPRMLKRYGFKTADEAIACYTGKNPAGSGSLAQNLLSNTPADSFLAANPPNVVFILMEGMNDNYFDLHTPETNILGKLEGQLADCYVFRNFLSASKGTIYSLEGILVGTPLSPISQSVYQDRSLSSSVAKPFKDKGYATSFITGSDIGWRSLDNFIYHQYFDNVDGKSALKKLYPDASTCEWGVHDEYTFKRIFDLLNTAAGKPQFIVGFTISNHTPYETPESYKQYPLALTDDIKARLKATPEIAHKNLLAYQYANNCLGRFIEDIKNSPLGENTIIVATGDHANLQIFQFPDKDLIKMHFTPLIIYVPENYRPHHEVNTRIFGSHKDVFPTIFNLALSNTTYLNTGTNLLAADSGNNFGVYCYCLAMNFSGGVDFQDAPLFYKWDNDSRKTVAPVDGQPDDQLSGLYLKARAHAASMKYYIMTELQGRKVGE